MPVHEHSRQFILFSLAQEKKIACMVIWINITCFVCWMPILIASIMQVTSAQPSPFLHAIFHRILHLGVIVHAVLNLYFRGDLRNAMTRSCLQNRNVSEDTELSIIHPISIVANVHAQSKSS